MKPIILKVDSEGKILISADEIQKMVDDAYNTGYADGSNSNVCHGCYKYAATRIVNDTYKITIGDETIRSSDRISVTEL